METLVEHGHFAWISRCAQLLAFLQKLENELLEESRAREMELLHLRQAHWYPASSIVMYPWKTFYMFYHRSLA